MLTLLTFAMIMNAEAYLSQPPRRIGHQFLKTNLPASKGFGAKEKVLKNDLTKQPEDDSPCGCSSDSTYVLCCKRAHDGGKGLSPLELLRARFTAHKYRVTDFLVQSTYKFALKRASGPDLEKRSKRSNSKEEKKEINELIQFIDSYDFEDLEVESSEDSVDSQEIVKIKFSCKLKAANHALEKIKGESEFLKTNVVDFKEVSTFRKHEGEWYYDTGDVEYAGTSLAEEFAGSDIPITEGAAFDERVRGDGYDPNNKASLKTWRRIQAEKAKERMRNRGFQEHVSEEVDEATKGEFSRKEEVDENRGMDGSYGDALAEARKQLKDKNRN